MIWALAIQAPSLQQAVLSDNSLSNKGIKFAIRKIRPPLVDRTLLPVQLIRP